MLIIIIAVQTHYFALMTDLSILNLRVEYNNDPIHLLELEKINFEVKII